MIGPVGTPAAGVTGSGAAKLVKLAPSGVQVSGKLPLNKPSIAAEIAAQGAPVDTSRVAEFKSAIAEGRYVLDSKAVADAMIADETAPK